MRLLISMIGLGDARTHTYQALDVRVPWAENAQRPEREAYHQLALTRALQPDGVWLVGTQAAKEAHAGALPHDIFIVVPPCEADHEFWDMFATVAQWLQKLPYSSAPHELHVDLTHGYRTQPMFLLSAVRYACRLHSDRLQLAGVYYSVMDFERKLARVRQVAPILEMEQVAADVYALVAYAQPGPLATRLHRLQDQRSRAAIGSGDKPPPQSGQLRQLVRRLRQFAAVVGINYTPIAADVVRALCGFADELAASMAGDLRPMGMALAQLAVDLRRELPPEASKLWQWHAALARWCAKRNLLQQALTHADELVVTRACEETGVDPLDRDRRQPIRQALMGLGRDGARVPLAWQPIVGAWHTITGLRNDVNHAHTGRGGTADQAQAAEQRINRVVEVLVAANCAMNRLPPVPD